MCMSPEDREEMLTRMGIKPRKQVDAIQNEKEEE